MSAPSPSMYADEVKIDELIGKVDEIKKEIEDAKVILANDADNMTKCTGFTSYISNYNDRKYYETKMDNLIILNEKLQSDLESAKLTAKGISQGTTTGTPTLGINLASWGGMFLSTLGEGFLKGFEDIGDAAAFLPAAFGWSAAGDWLKKDQSSELFKSLYNNAGATNTFRDTAAGKVTRWFGRAVSLAVAAGLTGAAVASLPVSAPIAIATVAGITGFGASVEKNLNAGASYGEAGLMGACAFVRDAVLMRLGLRLPGGLLTSAVAVGADAALNAAPPMQPGSPSGQPSGNSSSSQTEPEPDPSPGPSDDGDSYQPGPGTEDNGNGGDWGNSSDSGNYDDYTPTPDTGTTAVTETELTSKEGLIPVQPTDEAKIEELKPTDNTEKTTTDQQNTNGENVITTEQSTNDTNNQPTNPGENVTTIQDNPGETVVTETRYVQPEGNYQGYSYNENEGVSAPELETTPELDPNAIEDETELLTDIGELEDTTASFEDVIQANEYVKIPTSTTPIQTNPTSSGGNAFIPIAAGLSAAAAAGIGAKAYMDRKHNNDNGEEEDDFSEEWSDDYSDDNSITINENSADNQSESLLEDDYTYTEPEKYGARNNEELADLQ